jgi:hypothetical protein
LKPQLLQEIRARLKQDEPAPNIARSYNLEVDVIRELERAH